MKKLIEWAEHKLTEIEKSEEVRLKKEEEEKEHSRKLDAPEKVPAPKGGYYCRQVKVCLFYLYDAKTGERWCTCLGRSKCPAFREEM